MSSKPRRYQGESAHARAEKRQRQLLDTALELMTEEGWREVTIGSLCRAAKLNKRYFYESFSDLDALAAAVVDDLSATLIEIALSTAQDASVEGVPTEAMARRVLERVLGFLLDDPRRARALFSEVAQSPAAVAQRRSAVAAFATTLSDFGHVHHAAQGETDPIAPLAATMLIGGTIDAVVDWLDGRIPMTRDELIDDVAALWVVTGDGAAARARARRPS